MIVYRWETDLPKLVYKEDVNPMHIQVNGVGITISADIT